MYKKYGVSTLFIFIMLIISSQGCLMTQSFLYNEVKLKKEIKGKVGFVGCLIKNPLVTWSEAVYGSGSMNYTVKAVNPEILFNLFLIVLNDDIRKKLANTSIDENTIIQFNKELKDNYWRADNINSHHLPLFDNEVTGMLNKICLKYLNEKVKKDYYLVVYGDYYTFSTPKLFNAFRFSLKPRIIIALYDKTGCKIFSKAYISEYNKVQDDYQMIRTWHLYLGKALYDNREKIVQDLSFIIKADDSVTDNLQMKYEELRKKRN